MECGGKAAAFERAARPLTFAILPRSSKAAAKGGCLKNVDKRKKSIFA
jgi:hypothetical protein